METFGSYLKAQREKKGIRLEEIASITKIHLHTLELLETNQWDKLPPEPFIKGFIVAYGKYIGLDTREIVDLYNTEVRNKSSNVAETASEGPTPHVSSESAPLKTKIPGSLPSDLIGKNKTFSPWKLTGTLGVILVIAAVSTIIYLGKKDAEKIQTTEVLSSQTSSPADPAPDLKETKDSPTPTNTSEEPRIIADAVNSNLQAVETDSAPPVIALPPPLKDSAVPPTENAVPAKEEPVLTPTPAPVAETPKEKTSTLPIAAAPPKIEGSAFQHHISIEGKERTWIKIVIDNNPPMEYFLPQGNKVSYKAKEKIKIVLGNSTGSKVYHNGQLTEGQKFIGTIRSYKFPPEADFPQDVSSKRSPSSVLLDQMEGTSP